MVVLSTWFQFQGTKDLRKLAIPLAPANTPLLPDQGCGFGVSAKDNIRYLISPGDVDTPMLRYAREQRGISLRKGQVIPIQPNKIPFEEMYANRCFGIQRSNCAIRWPAGECHQWNVD